MWSLVVEVQGFRGMDLEKIRIDYLRCFRRFYDHVEGTVSVFHLIKKWIGKIPVAIRCGKSAKGWY